MISHGFLTSGEIIPSWDGTERYPGCLEIVAVTLTPGVVVAGERTDPTRSCVVCVPMGLRIHGAWRVAELRVKRQRNVAAAAPNATAHTRERSGDLSTQNNG